MTSLRVLSLAGSCLAGWACGDESGNPAGLLIEIASGEYEGVSADNRVTVGFPHEGGTEFEMTLDRDAGTVEIRYSKQGALIVEHWRITGRR